MTSVELATAYVSIVPEGSKIAPEVKRQFGKVGVEADRAGKDSGKRFSSGFGGSIKALAIGGAGVAVGKFFKDAIAGASDLNESSTKITAIFGGATGAVQKFASGGAKALGQTKLEVLDAAASFGTFGKAAGLTGPALAKFSTGFAGLSTDLASFFNTDPAQAAEAIGAALRGEAEPIRQFGVLLDDATLRNEALRLGLIKTTKTALTPQQKVLAAQAAIYKQTKDAQGDFARTSSGLANQQRILKAQFSDVRAEMGTKLLPVATKLVTKTSELVTEFQNGTGAGGDIRDVLEDVGAAGKGVAKFFDSIPGPVKKFGAEGLIAAAVLSKFRTLTGPATTNIGNFASGLRNAETRMATFRSTAGQLAGAAGIGLIVSSASTANQSLSFLEKAGGGALLGFSVGGPIGAAIGGTAGAIIGLATATSSSANEFIDAKAQADKYAESLRGVMDASSSAARQKAIDILKTNSTAATPQAVAATKALGISQRDLVNIITGEIGARSRVAAIVRKASKSTDAATVTNAAVIRDLLLPALDSQRHKLKDQIVQNKEYNHEVETLRNLVKQLPAKAQTDIVALHGKATIADIKDLTKKYNLTPKQVQTVIEATGVAATVADIDGVNKKMNNLNGKTAKVNIVANLPAWLKNDLGIPGTSTGTKPPHRAMGGPVKAGQPYIVGEHRPELFVPSSSGRIQPRVQAASGSISAAGGRVAMTVTNWQDGTGYFEEIADSRVDSAAALSAESGRAL